MSKYSVESFTFNKLQLMQTFYDKNIPFDRYIVFTEEIFNQMNKSQTLKDVGFQKIDFHRTFSMLYS